jgi:NodT family efflux transporter outer membrane factor (OMF) lipoprotein
MLRTIPLLLWSAIVLAGCAHLKRHQAPLIADLPKQFVSAPTVAFVDVPWWPVFQDAALSSLIEEALASSPTMEIALARLEQYQSAYYNVSASLFPTVSTSGAVQSGAQQLVERYNDTFRAYSVRANTVYELDFWQKLSSGRRRAAAELIAGRNDAYASVITLTSQIARTYYTTVRIRQELRLLQDIEASYVLDSIAVKKRYTLSQVTALDVFQAQTALSQTRALIELIAPTLGTEEHALSLLLGHYPRITFNGRLDSLPHSIDTIRAGLPSELLERRPDIQSARARLASADYSWAAARAERFPSLTLTGSGGNVSHDLKDALDPTKMTLALATGLTIPIFEGGRLKAQEEGAVASFREVSAQYEATVLNAFREVEDALTLGEHEVEAIRQLEIAKAAADSSLRIAMELYRRGKESHLTVILAQTAMLDAARNLINARFDLLTFRIDLATALGGSWTEEAIQKFSRSRHPVPTKEK